LEAKGAVHHVGIYANVDELDNRERGTSGIHGFSLGDGRQLGASQPISSSGAHGAMPETLNPKP